MGKNAIEFHRKNTVTIICVVTGLVSLAGYAAVLTAKVYKDDETVIITKVGSIVDLTITFLLGSTETDKTERIYHYDIVITKPPVAEEDPLEYTVAQDTLRVLKSVSN